MGLALYFPRWLDQDRPRIALLGNRGFLLHSLHRQDTEFTRIIYNSSMVAKVAANMVLSEESAAIKLPARAIRAASSVDTVKALPGTITTGITSNAVDGVTIMGTNR